MTLLRGLGVDMEARRDSFTDHISEGVSQISKHATLARRRVAALPQTARPWADALMSAPGRVWASERTTTICVVGGFMAAPLLTILAWAGLLLPAGMPLHQNTETLFVVSIVLLGLALVSAHAQQHRHTLQDD